ncbi:hypothetical protein ES705_22204 [subsurface metagenome]
MTSNKKWEPKEYVLGHENDIVELMQKDIQIRGSKAIFNKEFWEWKYKNNNAGFFQNWILLAKSKTSEKIGGHYTAIPVELMANGNTVLSAQSVDTLTHVNFRKQGIFTGLAQLCYGELVRDHIDIIYGYPNDNSYPGFVKKLDWNHIFVVKEVVFILNPKKIAELKFKNGFKKVVAFLALKTFFSFRNITNKLIPTNSVMIININIDNIDYKLVDKWISSQYNYYVARTLEYFKWRYIENPIDRNIVFKSFVKNNEVKGYYILKFKTYPHRKNLAVCHIMELLSGPRGKKTTLLMINDIIKTCQQKNADIIHSYTHLQQHDHHLYKKTGFIQYDSKNYIIRINNNKEKYPGILKPENWFISLGDSDRA